MSKIEKKENDMLETARVGIEVERFFNSDVGKYVVSRANSEANAAIAEMKTVDYTDSAACAKIQADLNAPDNIIHWLTEVINEGQACEFQLKQMDELEDE